MNLPKLILAILFFGVTLVPTQARASSQICDAKTFGAKGDGITLDTKAIQSAIDACAVGGGIVSLHDGTFKSGMITLKSNIEFRIEATAKLKGSQDDRDYPDTNVPTVNSQLLNCNKTLVFAQDARNIRIDGGGTIDGSGTKPEWNGKERTRPMAIFLALSDDVTIQDVNVQDAGMWGVVTFETDHILIQNIKVHSATGPTRDGIDIVDGHHVLIDHVEVFSEDDSICLKSGSAKGVYDVTVSNSRILQSSVANGLKLGTAGVGSFKKVLFKNISIQNVDKAAMAVESVDGAQIEDIQFQNVYFHQAGSAIFILLGKRGNPKSVGSIQNVGFTDVSGDTRHPWGSAISGLKLDGQAYPVRNLVFRRVHIWHQGGLNSVPQSPAEYAGQYPDPNL